MVMASTSLSSRTLRKSWCGGGSVAELFLRGGGVFGQDVGLDIADVGDARSGLVGFERREMRVGAAVEADDGEVEAFVGAHDLAVALCGGGDCQARRADCKCVEKLPSRNHLFSCLNRAPVLSPPCERAVSIKIFVGGRASRHFFPRTILIPPLIVAEAARNSGRHNPHSASRVEFSFTAKELE